MLPYRVRISCLMGSGKALGSGYAGGFGCGLRATHVVYYTFFSQSVGPAHEIIGWVSLSSILISSLPQRLTPWLLLGDGYFPREIPLLSRRPMPSP